MDSWFWVLVGIFAVGFAYYRYFVWHYGIFKRLGINGPRPLPVVGTMLPMMREGLIKYDMDLMKYGGAVGTFQGSTPMIMVFDREMLKQILVKDFSNFTNRFDPSIFNEYPMNLLLTILKNEHWKHVRSHLIPTFSAGKLKKMNGKMMHCVETFLKNLEKKADGREIFDLRELCGAFTMDVIASTAFGLQIDSHNDPNNMFVKMGKKAFDFSFVSLRTLILFFFPFLAQPLAKLGISIFPRDVSDFFGSAVDQAMSQRQTRDKDDVDFIQLMMNARLENEDNEKNVAADKINSKEHGWTETKGLTYKEVLAQGILFFLAGYETTANTLSLLGYELAVHPDVQERLIKEIDEIMKDQKNVTYDLVQKMPYLDMCLSEVLRLYPAGPRTDRVAKNDIVINGVFIPKGMTLTIPIYALQNDPDVWPNPEKFDPERFTPEAKESHDQFSYLPFGMGPRNCVGMRLALMELKMSAVHVLQRLKFVACEQTEIPLKIDKLKIQGLNGIKLRMQRR